jgi:hypothetical protein
MSGREVMMGIFKQRKSDFSGPDVPMDQVVAMKGQGYTNNQIIQTLQRDGYTSSQIFDAISQSEMAGQTPAVGSPMQAMQVPDMQQDQYTMQQMPMMQQPAMPAPISGASTEEIIEAIIDEKWNDLVKDINKVIEWKQKADSKLISMEQQMTELRSQFDKLQQAILGKISDYDKNMMDVGAELQAMEKAFSKVLPQFIDNVSQLNTITERMKSPSKVTKK